MNESELEIEAAKRIVEEYNDLAKRVDRLQEQNTIEVQRRQELVASLAAIKAALQAAEKHSHLSHVGPQGVTIMEPCRCASCVTVRGIAAFLEKP